MNYHLNSFTNPVAVFLFLLSTTTTVFRFIFPSVYDRLQKNEFKLPFFQRKVNFLVLFNILANALLFSPCIVLWGHPFVVDIMSHPLILSEFLVVVCGHWVFIPLLNDYQFHLCCRLEDTCYSLALFYIIVSSVLVAGRISFLLSYVLPPVVAASIVLYCIGAERVAVFKSYISNAFESFQRWIGWISTKKPSSVSVINPEKAQFSQQKGPFSPKNASPNTDGESRLHSHAGPRQ